MSPRIFRFDESRREDFLRLHCDANGSGWCRCVAWWVPTWDGFGARTAAENLALREALCARGEYDGYLAYVDGAPAAWCQVGPRDRLEKLVRQYRLAPDPDAFAITCLFVAPAHRRRGVARELVAHVVEDLRAQRRARRIEAFPRRPDPAVPLADDDAWTGTVALFESAGFAVTRDDARFPVLAIDLACPNSL
jgi:GNAT superfamily N-acetyltransferase